MDDLEKLRVTAEAASLVRPASLQRFLSKLALDESSGCLIWTARKNHNGYGTFAPRHEASVRAHRFAYELVKGSIPAGLQIDHLCRNRACCNPDHLEAVTPAENTRRGAAGDKDRLKTHCPGGHAYDEANTARNAKGHRACRTCYRAKARRLRAGRKAAAGSVQTRDEPQ